MQSNLPKDAGLFLSVHLANMKLNVILDALVTWGHAGCSWSLCLCPTGWNSRRDAKGSGGHSEIVLMCSHQHISLKPKEWYNEVFYKTLYFPVCEHSYKSDSSLSPSFFGSGWFLWDHTFLSTVIISQFSRFWENRHWFLPYFHLHFFSLSEQEWSLLGHENGIFFSFISYIICKWAGG